MIFNKKNSKKLDECRRCSDLLTHKAFRITTFYEMLFVKMALTPQPKSYISTTIMLSNWVVPNRILFLGKSGRNFEYQGIIASDKGNVYFLLFPEYRA
jgi:hypothetical protein